MTLTITHNSVPSVPDDPAYPVGTDEWIAAHNISGTLPAVNGGSGLTIATTNVDLYVATTGSDSAAGTIGAPFLTVQKGLDTAASYNYQNTYTVTVHVADGTYTRIDGLPTTLPILIDYPINQIPLLTGNTTTRTNCVLHNTVADCIKSEPYSDWSVTGFQLKADNGLAVSDISAVEFASITIDKIDFAGSGVLCNSSNHSFILCLNSALSISSTSFATAKQAFFYGSIINDSAVTTISNAATVSTAFVDCGDHSIVGNGTFVNPGNITGPSYSLFNYGIWEINIPRSSLPGSGTGFLDDTARYGGDPSKIIYDGSGNALLDPTGAFRIGDATVDITPFGGNSVLQLAQGTAHAGFGLTFGRFDSTGGNEPSSNLVRSRSTTAGNFSIVSNGDKLGGFYYWADGGANYNNLSAGLAVTATGTPGAATVPGRLAILVCAQGDQLATEVAAANGVLRAFQLTGSLGRGGLAIHTTNFSVGMTENWLVNNKAGSSCTVTLPDPATFPGRELMIQNWQAQTVVSGSSNVVTIDGATQGTSILAATAGKWATMVTFGSLWFITQSN